MYFCDVISLLAQVFIVSFDRAYKEVSTKKYWNRTFWYFFVTSFLFMSNINCGIGVLHVKRQILMYFCDVISLLAQVFIVSFDRAYKEVSTKKYWKFSMSQFLWYDCTFKKQCTVPVTLTIDLWRSIIFQWIGYNPISILYKFQNDISSNSREIKYQNIGQTHRHTHRQTGWKQYLATPSGGEVIREFDEF